MNSVSICISFIVALLGVAYPIMFQVISSLDEKYSSQNILELFNKEKERKLFLFFLVISLISILLWALNIPPLFTLGRFNMLIENSAFILLSISTLGLVASFIFLVEKIMIYYTPTRFIKYLIKKDESNRKQNNYNFFKAISDILYYSIKKQNETLAKTISDFMYKAFQNFRNINVGKPIEYPSSFYEVVYKSIEELGSQESKKLIFLTYRTAGAIWLFGELKDNKISEITYNWIWRNLLLSVSFKKDDMIMHYWKNAHQFFTHKLHRKQIEYSKKYKIKNEVDIKERDDERKRFLELHYALGGLLLYEKRYECLGRIFKYTTSIPPRYELLPNTMNEIFNVFIQFRDPDEMKFAWISSQYSFPNVEGLNADSIIKRWINEYIAVLFLRQYSIQPYLITMKPLELPLIPKEQSKKRDLIENIDFFATLIVRVMENKELLDKINLNFLTDDWFLKTKKIKPLDFINQYKSKLEEAYELTKIEQEISESKQKLLEESSKKVIKNTISLYSIIKNSISINEEYNNWFIHGERAVVDKSAFTDNQDSHHMNFDSFLAEHISTKFQTGISETFYFTKSVKYLLEPKDVFSAIDNLKINSQEHVIISFGNNISYLKDLLSLNSLSDDEYNGIKIINFSHCNFSLVGESFFIIKSIDLPNIIHHSIEQSEIEKYSLSLIDDSIKLYSSVNNLNKDQNLQEELLQSHPDKDLNKSVLVNISMLTEIRWKKNISNVMIQSHSPYSERGIPNSLKDVKELNN
jgi:hypothetical protein